MSHRHRLVAVALALATLLVPLGVAPPAAEAGHGSWIAIAGAFAVGGAQFSFGYHEPGYGHYQPAYYYRVNRPLPYHGGHRCTTYCYVRDDYYYHHPSCPLVGAYFEHYNYRPTYYGHHRPYYVPRPYVHHRYHGHGRGHHEHYRGCGHDWDD